MHLSISLTNLDQLMPYNFVSIHAAHMTHVVLACRSSVKTGRAKRNATFPGGVATTYMAQYTGPTLQTPPVKCEAVPDRDQGWVSCLKLTFFSDR